MNSEIKVITDKELYKGGLTKPLSEVPTIEMSKPNSRIDILEHVYKVPTNVDNDVAKAMLKSTIDSYKKTVEFDLKPFTDEELKEMHLSIAPKMILDFGDLPETKPMGDELK